MKILGLGTRQTQSAASGAPVGKGATNQRAGATRSSGADQVRLSGASSQLAAAVQLFEARPPADPRHIAALRDAIANDNYELDVHSLAEAILREDGPGLLL